MKQLSDYKKCLIIEDEKDIREMYVTIMQSAGYDVRSASNGENGVLIASEFKPDFLMLDLMLSLRGMDGFDVIETLEGDIEKYGDIAIMIITNNSNEFEVKKAYKLKSVRGYLLKSDLTPEQVLYEVRSLLVEE